MPGLLILPKDAAAFADICALLACQSTVFNWHPIYAADKPLTRLRKCYIKMTDAGLSQIEAGTEKLYKPVKTHLTASFVEG